MPLRALLLVTVMLVALGAAFAYASPARASGFDSGAAEARLFREINSDRAGSGLPPLASSPALSNIARGASVSACGIVVHGRSQDMIERNYFSHAIPPCGTLVFPVLAAAGVHLSAAGENIGWNNVSPASASVDQANAGFMASPQHRANILGNYNQVGVGAFAAPGAWSGGGHAYSGAIVYTEIFGLGPITGPVLAPAPRPVPRAAPAPSAVVAPMEPVLALAVAPPAVPPPITATAPPVEVPVSSPGHGLQCAPVVPACSEQWLQSLGVDRAYYLRGPVELRVAALADALGLLRALRG